MGQAVSCLCGGDEEQLVQISREDNDSVARPRPVSPTRTELPSTKADQLLRKRELMAKEDEKACLQIERKIKHYSSSQKILLVGEGDFSFSACLALVFSSASNMVATSLDSQEFLFCNYKRAKSNIAKLRSRGCKVIHGVDATEMANNYKICHQTYDRIIFNFPHAGFFKRASREMQLKKNRRLVLKFLKNAMQLTSETGEVHITHKSNGFFLEWNLEQLASISGFRLIEEVPFNLNDYEAYNTKYGFGGDRNFNCYPSETYKFGLKRLRQC